MPYCFVLSCADDSYYAGSGMLLRSEVFKHMVGIGAPYTRDRRPVSLSWSEYHEDLDAATRRAREIGAWPKERVDGLIMRAYLRPRRAPAIGCLGTVEGRGRAPTHE